MSMRRTLAKNGRIVSSEEWCRRTSGGESWDSEIGECRGRWNVDSLRSFGDATREYERAPIVAVLWRSLNNTEANPLLGQRDHEERACRTLLWAKREQSVRVLVGEIHVLRPTVAQRGRQDSAVWAKKRASRWKRLETKQRVADQPVFHNCTADGILVAVCEGKKVSRNKKFKIEKAKWRRECKLVIRRVEKFRIRIPMSRGGLLRGFALGLWTNFEALVVCKKRRIVSCRDRLARLFTRGGNDASMWQPQCGTRVFLTVAVWNAIANANRVRKFELRARVSISS